MKKEPPWLLIVAAVLLLGGGVALAETAPSERAGRKPDDDKDGADLVRRANLPAAAAWRSDFASQGISDSVAAALSRWAGIESSGNPLGKSRLGERGLLQCSEKTALGVGGPYSKAEWESLADKGTSRQEHTRLAIQLYRWLWNHASKYIKDPPTEEIDQVWYAKLMHQWPADFHGKSSVGMHGPAGTMAHELAARWAANAPHSLHRLRAANVVAFGLPEPWGIMPNA